MAMDIRKPGNRDAGDAFGARALCFIRDGTDRAV
jgi:hypothetical protein